MSNPHRRRLPGSAGSKPCDECGKCSTLRCYRLDALNWRPTFRILCMACSKRLGFTPVNYERAYSGTGSRD